MREEDSSKRYLFYKRKWKEYYRLLKNIEQQRSLPPIASAVEEERLWHEGDHEFHDTFVSQIHTIGQKIQDLQWMSEHLKILHEWGQTFTHSFEQREIYLKAFELVSRVMPTDAFVISFYNEGDDYIHVVFMTEDGVEFDPVTLPFGPGNGISQVIKTRKTLHVKTAHTEETLTHFGDFEKETATCIFVPMMLGDQIKGVISAQSYNQFAYRKEHEELLEIIGIQLATAIETAKLYEKLYQASITDELTGLKNQRAFHQDLEKLTAEAAQRQGATLTLIMLDSDNLKSLNDQYGHHVGDLLLKQIANGMRFVLYEGEEAYRYAGDEFMILCPELSQQEATEKVNKILSFFQRNPLEYRGDVLPISVSVGIARYPEHAEDADSLKRVVDKAMYQSKSRGKNCTTTYKQ